MAKIARREICQVDPAPPEARTDALRTGMQFHSHATTVLD